MDLNTYNRGVKMGVTIYGPNGTAQGEVVDLISEKISAFFIRKQFKERKVVQLLMKEFNVGETRFILGMLTLEKGSHPREEDGKIAADVIFAYDEYRSLERFGTVINRYGRKYILATATMEKDKIMQCILGPEEIF
jgi:hypothetical protein